MTSRKISENSIEKGGMEDDMSSICFCPPPKLAAVVVRDADKAYKKDEPVLSGFNMTVEYGTIYSLLGESGCGKTSLLSCIVGARQLNRGRILVFGKQPGSRGSCVPGNVVGYMPQENSLYLDFTVAETLTYYGTLYGKDKKEIKESLSKLVSLLELPSETQIVGTLSGGQKRRVSFAVALFHQPDLLVLDEPTVGLDPLLVQKIWDHLVELVETRQTTVIVTTHYIQEARQSNTIGVMRNGCLIAEQSPEALMARFRTSCLDAAVLLLCKQSSSDSRFYNVNAHEMITRKNVDVENGYDDGDRMRLLTVNNFDNSGWRGTKSRIHALAHKNILYLMRNIFFLLFVVFVPGVIIFLIGSNVQYVPHDLNFGIVSEEISNSKGICDLEVTPPGICTVENLSCRFLRHFDPDGFNLKFYESEEIAEEKVEDGKAWGYLLFPRNFSTSFYERLKGGSYLNQGVMNMSEITVRLDVTSPFITGQIQDYIQRAFAGFTIAFGGECGFPPGAGISSLQFEKPIYGIDGKGLLHCVVTGMTLGLIFFFPIITSSIRYVGEKKQGTLERSMVAGVKIWEIMLAQSITDMILLGLQSAFIYYIVMEQAFDVPNFGEPIYAFALCFMSGLTGMSLGFLLGLVCTEEIQAALIAMVAFFPSVLFSGIFWPLQALPEAVNYLTMGLPSTLSIRSLRSIMLRGWDIDHPLVWPGFAVPMIYIFTLWTLTILLQKLKVSNN